MTIANFVVVTESGLQSRQELPLQVALVQSQAKRVSALSARCTSFEGTITEHKSSVTRLRFELVTLQTQAAIIKAAPTELANAGAYDVGRDQELERRLLSAQKDLNAVQAERRARGPMNRSCWKYAGALKDKGRNSAQSLVLLKWSWWI